jgi:glycosyltransferase involved in cell wall biosynthesis
VDSLQAQAHLNWELIIVDDRSADASARIAAALARNDRRIRLLTNPGAGQVQAINHGFGSCGGELLKIMDADDLLPPGFSAALPRLAAVEASYHDAYLLDERIGEKRRLRIGPRFSDLDLPASLRRIMISPPRWSWTMKRRVAERVFPLPSALPSPHEDVFIGLMVKRSARVEYVPRPLYVYRQHPGQFYGGLFNYDAPAVARRAKAMLGIIDIVGRSAIVGGVENAEALLAFPRTYFALLGRERLAWTDILRAPLDPWDKARLAVIRKAPALASRLSRWRAAGGAS